MIVQSILFGAALAKISSLSTSICTDTTGAGTCTDDCTDSGATCTCVTEDACGGDDAVDCEGWDCAQYESFITAFYPTMKNKACVVTDDGAQSGVQTLQKFECGGGGGVQCFSANSGVDTKQNGVIPMSELKAGDHVRVGPSEFSEVVGFIHKDLETSAQFLRFNDVFEVSEYHLVETVNGYSHAIDVELGEQLNTVDGPVEVESVDKVTRTGYMAPLTKSGTIAVDGFMASNYAHVPAELHWLADLMMYPRKCFTYESENTMDFYSWAMDSVLHPPFKALYGGY